MNIYEFIDGANYTYFRGSRPVTDFNFEQLLARHVKKILSLEYGWQAWFSGNLNQEIEMAIKNGIDIDSIRMSDFFAPSLEDLNTAADIIKKNPQCFVHCLHGVDRTGMVIAAFRIKYCGWNYEAAKKEMLIMGFHMFPYFFWLKRLKQFALEAK